LVPRTCTLSCESSHDNDTKCRPPRQTPSGWQGFNHDPPGAARVRAVTLAGALTCLRPPRSPPDLPELAPRLLALARLRFQSTREHVALCARSRPGDHLSLAFRFCAARAERLFMSRDSRAERIMMTMMIGIVGRKAVGRKEKADNFLSPISSHGFHKVGSAWNSRGTARRPTSITKSCESIA